jgi:putative Mg2+ transporter-C (MgtC) family protein
VFHADVHLLTRVALGIVVSFAFGFERQLRGSPAGNRTFALIGGTAAGVTAVAGATSPQAVAGILTGIGFIGAGFVFVHGVTVRGLTSASTVFAVAGIGIVFGFDHLFLGLVMAAIFMFILELQHIPFLRDLDASHIADRFANDFDIPAPGLVEPQGAQVPAVDGPGSAGSGSAGSGAAGSAGSAGPAGDGASPPPT